jgi:hypothetical protein
VGVAQYEFSNVDLFNQSGVPPGLFAVALTAAHNFIV